MDELRRISGHESGHVIAAVTCGLQIDGATIDRAAAGFGRSGCIWLTRNSYACKPLEAFSDISLHELMQPPLAKIEGQALSKGTCILLYAKIINLMAGKEAERLLFDQPPEHVRSSSDMRTAAFLVNCIAGTPKAALALLDFARNDASRILTARKHQAEAVAAALVQYRTLDAEQIEAVLAERPGVFRRKQWTAMVASAELFKTMTDGGLKRLNLVYGC
jgi:hypothetical protein